MDSSEETALMHYSLAFQMLHIANSTVEVEKPDNMAFHKGQQCLKYQYMMTQT